MLAHPSEAGQLQQHAARSAVHSPFAPPAHRSALPTYMHAAHTAVHSPFPSPPLSAASSPYISSNSSVSSLTGLALGGTAISDGAATNTATTMSSSSHSASSVEGMLVIGSRVRVRGTEFVHPKLAAYAFTAGEIVALPAHPNTWFGVRLHDGRVVKLRKSAFDVVSIYPSAHSHSHAHTAAGAAAAGHHQYQPHLYSSFTFSPFQQPHQPQQQPHFTVTPFPSHQPYSHMQAQQQPQQPQQTHHQQQIVYSSPSPVSSPSPSPTAAAAGAPAQSPPALSLEQAHASDPHAHHRIAPIPTIAPTIDTAAAPGAPSATGARAEAESERSHRLQAPEAGDAAMLSGSEDGSDARDRPEHDAEAEAEVEAEADAEHDAQESGQRSRASVGSTRVRAPPDADLVLHSKRKPVPRLMSPEAEDEDEEDMEDEGEDEGDDQPFDDDDDEEETYSRASSSKKSPHHRPMSTPTRKTDKSGGGGGGGSAKSTPSKGNGGASGGSKPVRSRRGRGRALLGLNVVITGGRYKGETGLVSRGANGYYCVKFHRPIAELRQHDNTAMKRSSELAPITAQGKRLTLPLPPAQRKLMKAQAAAGVGPAAAAVAMSSVQRESSSAASSRGASPNPTHKRKLAFPTPSRRSAVHRRRDASASHPDGSPRDDESDMNSEGRGRSRSRSPGVDSCSQTDEEQFDDEQVGLLYSSGDKHDHEHEQGEGGHRSERHWRRSSSGSCSSSSCSRSSSCMSSPSRSSCGMSATAGLQSPTQTELLSPASYPASPTGLTLAHTPISVAHSIPPSPSTLHHTQTGFLAPMSLPPAHSSGSGGKQSKSASMRAESPRVKQAACILLALSHEGLVVSPTTLEAQGGELEPQQLGIRGEPLQITYSLTHFSPSQPMAHEAFRPQAHTTAPPRTAFRT